MNYKPVISIFDVLKIYPRILYRYKDKESGLDFVFHLDEDGVLHTKNFPEASEYVGVSGLERLNQIHANLVENVLKNPDNVSLCAA